MWSGRFIRGIFIRGIKKSLFMEILKISVNEYDIILSKRENR